MLTDYIIYNSNTEKLEMDDTTDIQELVTLFATQ